MHAVLRPKPDGSVEVEDLDSTNGTYVDGRRAAPTAVLRPGAQLRVGTIVLRLAGPRLRLDPAVQVAVERLLAGRAGRSHIGRLAPGAASAGGTGRTTDGRVASSASVRSSSPVVPRSTSSPGAALTGAWISSRLTNVPLREPRSSIPRRCPLG